MKRLFLFPILLLSITLSSQVTEESAGPKTIKSTFDEMLAKSNRYQDFKVVKQIKLNAFIVEVQDSLDVLQKRYQSEVKAKQGLQNEVEKLNATINSRSTEIASLEGQRDSINTLGMDVDKGAFSTAMWVAVLGLLGLLVAVFLRNKSMALSQKAVKANLSDLEDELASTKKKALEREQELKREVQDYVNKIEAMGPPR
jgi:peptidoglycan hydrolase CwlO-like protein